MRRLTAPSRAESWLGHAIEIPAAALVVGEVVVLLAGVIMRFIFNSPIPWADELASILFLWLANLGAAVALRRGSHMRTTALVSRWSPRAQAWAETLAIAAPCLSCNRRSFESPANATPILPRPASLSAARKRSGSVNSSIAKSSAAITNCISGWETIRTIGTRGGPGGRHWFRTTGGRIRGTTGRSRSRTSMRSPLDLTDRVIQLANGSTGGGSPSSPSSSAAPSAAPPRATAPAGRTKP